MQGGVRTLCLRTCHWICENLADLCGGGGRRGPPAACYAPARMQQNVSEVAVRVLRYGVVCLRPECVEIIRGLLNYLHVCCVYMLGLRG